MCRNEVAVVGGEVCSLHREDHFHQCYLYSVNVLYRKCTSTCLMLRWPLRMLRHLFLSLFAVYTLLYIFSVEKIFGLVYPNYGNTYFRLARVLRAVQMTYIQM